MGTMRTPDAGAAAWEVIQVDTVCPGRRLEPLNCRTLIQPSCRGEGNTPDGQWD